METSDLVKKFTKLTKNVSDAEKEYATAVGRLSVLMDKLKSDFECSTVEEGNAMIIEYKEYCEGVRVQITELLDKVESLMAV